MEPTSKDRLAEAFTEGAKITPPAGVTGMHLVGIPLSEWVLGLTLVYTALLIIHKGVDLYRTMVRRPDGCRNECHERRCRTGDTS